MKSEIFLLVFASFLLVEGHVVNKRSDKLAETESIFEKFESMSQSGDAASDPTASKKPGLFKSLWNAFEDNEKAKTSLDTYTPFFTVSLSTPIVIAIFAAILKCCATRFSKG